MSLTFPAAIKNARADAVTTLVDAGTANPNGKMRWKDGGGDILADLNLSNPSFAAATGGAAVANAITSSTGVKSGAAITFDILDRDENLIYSGVIGTVGSGADLESNTSSIQVTLGESVDVTSYTYLEAS